MAVSGQVNSNTAGSGSDKSYFYVKWSRTGTWNSSTCGSNIKWELWLHNGDYWYTNAIRCYAIYVNGTKVSDGGVWSNYTTYGEFKLLEGTTTVQHNNDGTKTFNINFTGWFYSATNVSGSGDFTLDRIPRASTFTTSGNTIGSAINVSITRADSSFTHTVTLKFGSKTESKTNIGTSTSFTPDLQQYSSQIPNSMSGTATITVDTYNSGTKVGSSSQNITLNIPNTVKPSVPTTILTEAVSGLASKFGAYIQRKSRIRVQASASGIYGSTIINYEIRINGNTYNSNDITTGILYDAGENSCVVVVTDSRGQTNTATTTFNVLAYRDPQITKFTAVRNESTPTTLNCVFSVNITPLTVGGTNKNDHSIKLKLDGTTKFTDSTHYTLTDKTQNITNVDDLSSHTVLLEVTDYFNDNTNPITLSIPIGTSFSLMNFSADGRHMAIGQVYDSTLDVDLQIGNSLGVGGVKALYKDSNNYLANNVYEYTETITSNTGDSTHIVTIKRVGSIVFIKVKSTLSASSMLDGTLKNFANFPNWAKTAETETNIADGFMATNFGTSSSGISFGNFLSIRLIKSGESYRLASAIGKDNTDSSSTLYASMNYVIEQN